MARLYKHGREMLRVKLNLPDRTDGTTDRCKTRVYMADGKVLEKYQVRFHEHSPYSGPSSYLHDWGWHIIGQYGTRVTLESARVHYEKKGWIVQ